MQLSPLISTRKICKSYLWGKLVTDVLKDVSLDFYAGELVIIIGPSGSGKSTLLAALGGLLRPDAGSVMLYDKDLSALSNKQVESARLKHFGFIFQGFNLFSSLPSREQVSLTLEYCGFNNDEVQHRSRKALEQVEMWGKAGLKPTALSGGEKQRIAIARAVAKSPDVLFADEPTSNLDTENALLIIQFLRKLVEHNKTAVILVTHDTRLLNYADRVIALEDGKITSDERRAYVQ